MNKILIFGSLNIDDVYAVNHFVQPGESMISTGYECFPGGKGLNQSTAFAKAGADTYLSGKIGQDGQFLLDFLKSSGIHTELISTNGQKTGRAIIQVDLSGQNSILVYSGANAELTADDALRALDGFSKGDLLVMQNETSQTVTLLEAAYAQGVSIAFNPSPIDHKLQSCDLNKVAWLFINEVEGFALTGEKEPDFITNKLLIQYPNLKIILTLGKDGVRYQDSHCCHSHGIYPVPVVDTTAAGDTFTGFFLSAVTQGKTVPDALELASIASSLAVSRKGAACSIPTINEVLAYRSKQSESIV